VGEAAVLSAARVEVGLRVVMSVDVDQTNVAGHSVLAVTTAGRTVVVIGSSSFLALRLVR
jgi:hypothetical protein